MSYVETELIIKSLACLVSSVILGKIRDVGAMDTLLYIFCSDFTIKADDGKFDKGSKKSYKLNEPYNGFIENSDFILGGCVRHSSDPF